MHIENKIHILMNTLIYCLVNISCNMYEHSSYTIIF